MAAGHSPLSLLLIDVDRLKRVNDEAGHAAGDQMLQQVATAIKGSLRTIDVGARWGGDEFAVLAPNTAPDAAERMAQRLLSEMERQDGRGGGSRVHRCGKLRPSPIVRNSTRFDASRRCGVVSGQDRRVPSSSRGLRTIRQRRLLVAQLGLC